MRRCIHHPADALLSKRPIARLQSPTGLLEFFGAAHESASLDALIAASRRLGARGRIALV